MELLHLTGLVKQVASFDESENHATTELKQPGGVSSQFSTPYAIKFGHFAGSQVTMQLSATHTP